MENIPGKVVEGGSGSILAAVSRLPHEPDVIINNYGYNHLSWIGTTQEEDERILMINVMGPYWVINHVKAFWGGPCRVINIASQTHRVPQRCTTLYSASKAALVQMTKVMSRELAPEGWVINAVSPGKITDTSMSKQTDAQVRVLRGWDQMEANSYALSNVPMRRFTSREEIAEVVVQVLGLPDYVNGTVIEAHGGI